MVEVLFVGGGVLQFGLTLDCADHRLGFELVSIVTIERRVSFVHPLTTPS